MCARLIVEQVSPNANLGPKYADLVRILREMRSVIVAFSGGVDSSFVLKVAVEALGCDSVLAVTGRSASVPRGELDAAAAIAAEIGAAHEYADTAEFDDPNYLSNPANRCYFCKDELYGRLSQLAKTRGFHFIVNGVNADDLGDFRPGLTAAREHSVRAPLVEAGVTKAELRAWAAQFDLSVHDKPASPCLSSRIQYGESITPEKLRRIDDAESFLRSLGFRECRVRHHHDLARVEVPPSELARFADAELRATIDRRLCDLGYKYVTLDLRGFRSGSMNEVLVGDALRAAHRPA